MSLYEATVPQFKKMLGNLDKWLDAAVAHAKARSFDPSVLLNARLAPDQYALTRQIQAACDSAKGCAARLTGKTPPTHPDTEVTLEEIRARIKTVVAYLDSVPAADYAGAETRKIELPFAPGKWVGGTDYVYELTLPNFYFHITLAYEILRHNGVEIGKMAFIGSLTLHDN